LVTDFDAANRVLNLFEVIGLGESDFDAGACLGHDAKGVLGVLVEFDVDNVVGSVLLALPATGREISVPVEFGVVHDNYNCF
jgi:hypothetical protein